MKSNRDPKVDEATTGPGQETAIAERREGSSTSTNKASKPVAKPPAPKNGGEAGKVVPKKDKLSKKEKAKTAKREKAARAEERKAAKKAAKAAKAEAKKVAKKAAKATNAEDKQAGKPLSKKAYEQELARLQVELGKFQNYVRHEGLKIVIIFEGRDAAGKGGAIKRIIQRLNPRICRVVALGTPTEREKSQWYFQRYVQHLPAAGEVVFFDRSWYNRAGVERVMGFCTEEEYQEFFRATPEFERTLVRSGITLIKYWFSVSDEEQERRFHDRINDPTKRWKLSPMDTESRARWVDYSKAKDAMFQHTDIKQAPWYVVPADVKRHARLNVISHLLSQFAYKTMKPKKIKLPERQKRGGYVRPPMEDQTIIPEVYP